MNDEAIWDDPRVFILLPLRPGVQWRAGLRDEPGSERGRQTATAATGWRYVGADSVAGRPAHHLTCAGGDLWIDDATRLILRVRQPDLDDAGNPIPGGAVRTTEVTKIEFGEQPAALFALTPPNGVAAMSTEAYQRPLSRGHDGLPGARPVQERRGGGRRRRQTPEPSPTPTVRPDPGDCAIPSRDPSEPTGPLAWTQASLTAGLARAGPPRARWRGERPADASDLHRSSRATPDPTVLPCIDIRDLTVDTYDVALDLVSNRPPDVDPSKAWIAYGVVVDDDRDGVPDWRYGIDNLPRTAGDENGHHREWRTNLHTGRTESVTGSDWAKVSETLPQTGYPAEGDREGWRFGGDGARFRFGHESDTTQGTNTHGVKVKRALLRVGLGDRRWPGRGHGLRPGRRLAPSVAWSEPGGHIRPPGRWSVAVAIPSLDEHPERLVGRWSRRVGHRKGDEGDVGIGLEFMIVDEPLEIACDRSGDASEVHVGPSVDDLVTFLEGLQTNEDLGEDGRRAQDLGEHGRHGRWLSREIPRVHGDRQG